MSERHCEVIVVGAGPAGCFTALNLAEAGHEVTLLERSPGPRDGIVCTGIVGREAFGHLDIPDGSARDVIRRARFYSPAGVQVDFEPGTPLAHVVDRTAFDTGLLERAEEAGVEVRHGYEARGMHRTDNGVVLECRNGALTSLHARALVVATGHQPWLHKAAGFGSPPSWVTGVHADLPFEDLDAAELYFGNDVAPGFFSWAVPFGDGKARLGVLAENGAHRIFRKFLEIDPIRRRLGVDPADDPKDTIGRAMRSRGIVQGTVDPSYAERALAVGEAAGQVKTTTAGGIYYGMIGGEVAAEVLSDGLKRDRLDAAWLSRYQEEWESKLGSEIDAGLELQRVAQGMSDSDIDQLFKALSGGLGAAVRQVVRFDWHKPALKVLFRGSRLRRMVARRFAPAEVA
ncbi:MAG: NAD(P)/FAD-dependent oxidoreductase [Gemmatimonadota bacterium]|nr:NAD(P)/FAD-dependent oxidoreductase [Gemmatimonadota bacterium]